MEVFDEPLVDVRLSSASHLKKKTYEAALGTIKNMGQVVESLYVKVRVQRRIHLL